MLDTAELKNWFLRLRQLQVVLPLFHLADVREIIWQSSGDISVLTRKPLLHTTARKYNFLIMNDNAEKFRGSRIEFQKAHCQGV